MKLQLKYPIGVSSPFRKSPLLTDDGIEVGEVLAYHPTSGWRGRVSEYQFRANDTGLKLGLPRAVVDARTQRELLKQIAFSVLPARERLCTPMTVGEASIAASTVR